MSVIFCWGKSRICCSFPFSRQGSQEIEGCAFVGLVYRRYQANQSGLYCIGINVCPSICSFRCIFTYIQGDRYVTVLELNLLCACYGIEVYLVGKKR